MKISAPGVVTKAAPEHQHVIECGGRKTFYIRKKLHESQVVGNHCTNLGLLQHDFRYPDSVWIAGALPRQMVAPVAFLPTDQLCGKRIQTSHGGASPA